MTQIYEQMEETLAFIRRRTSFEPAFGLILGTGLSNLADDMEIEAEMSYTLLPYFPVSTVKSHRGKLLFGTLGGVPVVAMAGRFHYYEGYTMQQLTFPVRVLKGLGIRRLLVSNAAGSTNAAIESGDVVCIKDHINLQPDNPLRGINDDRLGPRFPDMLGTYDRALNAQAIAICERHGLRAHEGTYVALPGPNLETPAEYRFLNIIGGDVVGMSTVPEILVARHMDLPVFALSVVSNKCFPIEDIQPTTVESVLEVVRGVEERLRRVVVELLQQMF